MVIIYFFDLVHHTHPLVGTEVREKLLNLGQLRNRHLIVELLAAWTVVLVIGIGRLVQTVGGELSIVIRRVLLV